MATEKGRWAIIVKETGEVSDIKIMEGNAKPDITHPERYDVVQVDGDVKIGMVRKGGSYAFPRPELQKAAEAEKADKEGDGDKAGAKATGDTSAKAAPPSTKPADKSADAGKGARA